MNKDETVVKFVSNFCNTGFIFKGKLSDVNIGLLIGKIVVILTCSIENKEIQNITGSTNLIENFVSTTVLKVMTLDQFCLIPGTLCLQSLSG